MVAVIHMRNAILQPGVLHNLDMFSVSLPATASGPTGPMPPSEQVLHLPRIREETGLTCRLLIDFGKVFDYIHYRSILCTGPITQESLLSS